ncbi:MAG: hypothetical protein U5L09_17300 [Bacteroidales bacterium]|nr:hypothetical protein [Bacteroidales bacterium]
MNRNKKYMKAALPILVAFLFASVSGYSQQQEISGSLTKVKTEVDQINRLANHHQVYDAIALLRQSRRDFEAYVKQYFPDEYRNALSENPEYTPSLQLSFSPALTAAYWEDRVKRAQRAVDNARSAFSDRHHQRTLDGQDLTWTYLKTAYEVAKTIKDVAESVTTQEYIEAFQNAKEGWMVL